MVLLSSVLGVTIQKVPVGGSGAWQVCLLTHLTVLNLCRKEMLIHSQQP